MRADQLSIETRSPGEADALRREVEERLGATLRFVERVVEAGSHEDDEDGDDQDGDSFGARG